MLDMSFLSNASKIMKPSSNAESNNKSVNILGLEPYCESNIVCMGKCLARYQVCDTLMDCEDGTDEDSCGVLECIENEFKCLKGRCIPDSWKCDGKPDCGSG